MYWISSIFTKGHLILVLLPLLSKLHEDLKIDIRNCIPISKVIFLLPHLYLSWHKINVLHKQNSFLIHSWLHFRVVTDPVGSYLTLTAVSVLALNFSCRRSHQIHLEIAAAIADSNRAFHALSFSTSTTEKYLWGMHLQRFGYLALQLKFIFTILTWNRGSTLEKKYICSI